MRHHFDALLAKINPTKKRVTLVADRTNELRDWLEQHEYKTVSPHTRLSGSYGRSTAIEAIPDVDVLVFIPESERDRTPNAVLIELHKTVKDYPGKIDSRPQRRSIRIELEADGVCLDIVPSIARNGLDRPLLVPDRCQAEWIASDPLGNAERLSSVNAGHGRKLVPLVKLLKAWRDEQMATRRPKSYVLEVMLLLAVEEGELALCDRSTAENVRDAFVHITDKYADLMDNRTGVPRIPDPQVPGHFITKGWERSHFETFMRRARDARRAAERAIGAEDEETASAEWKKVFGSQWPSESQVKEAARVEARKHQLGSAKVDSIGRVIGGAATVPTLKTRYHGVL
jgi:hypothetical protein